MRLISLILVLNLAVTVLANPTPATSCGAGNTQRVEARLHARHVQQMPTPAPAQVVALNARTATILKQAGPAVSSVQPATIPPTGPVPLARIATRVITDVNCALRALTPPRRANHLVLSVCRDISRHTLARLAAIFVSAERTLPPREQQLVKHARRSTTSQQLLPQERQASLSVSTALPDRTPTPPAVRNSVQPDLFHLPRGRLPAHLVLRARSPKLDPPLVPPVVRELNRIRPILVALLPPVPVFVAPSLSAFVPLGIPRVQLYPAKRIGSSVFTPSPI
ncbi:hypothetical protein BCR39DRAFT_560735 [Naematelia encephala]|uniref:Uncharacterized protein n=1 Tax=Naematelia encephala TaxID=71784 RepID=A0A1Y2AU08_9TREE|nr:hypothetical protein BCR39DRAFT_560735 [Naematelia encephala]